LSFRSFALPEFWKCYEELPAKVQTLAGQKFTLFNSNLFHPSLALKQKGGVRDGRRDLAGERGNDTNSEINKMDA
jgi:hypothetical protein